MELRKRHQVRQARHGSVVIHHFTDNAGRIQPGEPRDIDGRLGMSGALKDAAVLRHQREHVPRRHDILGALRRIDRDRDGPRSIRCGDPGGHPVPRLDGDGKCRLIGRLVILNHQLQADMVDPFAGHGEANQPTAEFGHEVDRLRRRHLAGDHEIAFVLAAFIIDQDHHAAITDIFDHILDRRQKFIVTV